MADAKPCGHHPDLICGCDTLGDRDGGTGEALALIARLAQPQPGGVPVSAVDQGLDAAVQRVAVEVARHTGSGHFRSCPCGWSEHGMPATYAQHVAEAIARAARVDVPALTQQARADELDKTAADLPSRTESIRRDGTKGWESRARDVYSLAVEESQGVLRTRAAAIREGREP